MKRREFLKLIGISSSLSCMPLTVISKDNSIKNQNDIILNGLSLENILVRESIQIKPNRLTHLQTIKFDLTILNDYSDNKFIEWMINIQENAMDRMYMKLIYRNKPFLGYIKEFSQDLDSNSFTTNIEFIVEAKKSYITFTS